MARGLRLSLALVAAASLLVVDVWGDVYMHMPRGSNDRNCERNVNRDNNNRLFDSQNNAKGGYACPRAVGDQTIQPESGQVVVGSITQNKRMYYYSGSILPIEWTNQHGCGENSKVNCEIVLQYACEDTLDPKIDNFWPWTDGKNGVDNVGTQHFADAYVAAPRDGVPRDSTDAATDTIPDDETSAIPSSVETRRFGMHESYDYYQLCQHTERNKGLYTADQNVRRNDQRGTRQNPNGNRQGLECPEEREYYPWWMPSPWIDVAVMTNNANETMCNSISSCDTARCKFYMNNTFNTNEKCYCDVKHTTGTDATSKTTNTAWQNRQWYNHKSACEAKGFVWYCVDLSTGMGTTLPNPACVLTQFSRINHLGSANPSNGGDGVELQVTNYATPADVLASIPPGTNANRFYWAIPTIPGVSTSWASDISTMYKSCALRIRYNITSSDFPVWPNAALSESSKYYGKMVDYNNNSRYENDPRTPLIQDPFVYIGPGDATYTAEPLQFLALKVNTNQYGRTFQDRSYVFSIKAFPTADAAADATTDTPQIWASLMNTKITAGTGLLYNIGVRGKRGNIVQTYPAVEYDFVPNSLMLTTNDMVHFQWTGSDYNPRRGCNDATGGPPDPNDFTTISSNDNARADRSNVCLKQFQSAEQPRKYITDTTSTLQSTRQSNAESTVTPYSFCYDSTGTTVTELECWDMLMWLCFLNQDEDGISLEYRQNKDCLTETEVDAITDENLRDNHPLNCAKLNAKPYPYFDGGVIPLMQGNAIYAYFSSRNNNFSNRDQSGVICVSKTTSPTYCASNFYDSKYSILQDRNPFAQGVYNPEASQAQSFSTCIEQASATNVGNSDGAKSCISYGEDTSILSKETFYTQASDSDAKGDGDKKGCNVLTSWWTSGTSTAEKIGLAIGLLFVGLFVSWASYYTYNRYKARGAAGTKFGGVTSWMQKPKTNEMI